ncbi:hypothetical protein EVI01_18980 [Enterococcus villorum]|uniref:Uncharacterized protein n=1 Tax=Enterococcus villorum TaxID=112904 RepID=A0A511J3J0_9ENTE|nr:hypothetical protein EVI01_18980 [Enterococcus villorum]
MLPKNYYAIRVLNPNVTFISPIYFYRKVVNITVTDDFELYFYEKTIFSVPKNKTSLVMF